MKDPSLPSDVAEIATLRGDFLLRSGQRADTYFDKYRFEADPQLLRRVARQMARLVPAGTEVLAGLELGGVPLATALSLETGLAARFVRKQAKDYGTCLAVEGGDVAGRAIVLVEDVITTGGAVKDAARMIDEAGGQILGVICAIWRGQGAPAIAGLPHLPVFAVMSRDELVL